MEANQIINLGPLQLPLSWLLLLIGLITSTYISEKIAIKRGWQKGKWSDLVITLSFIFILIYKFGWVLFDLKRVINNPSSIFWITGSTTGFAILVVLIVIAYKIYKEKLPVIDVLDFVLISFTFTYFLISLFVMDYGKITEFFTGVKIEADSSNLYHPVNWYRSILLGVLLIFRFIIWKNPDKSKIFQLYIFLGLGLLLVSIFDISVDLIYGLTQEQWLYILLTTIGLLGITKYNKS